MGKLQKLEAYSNPKINWVCHLNDFVNISFQFSCQIAAFLQNRDLVFPNTIFLALGLIWFLFGWKFSSVFILFKMLHSYPDKQIKMIVCETNLCCKEKIIKKRDAAQHLQNL